MAAPSRRSICAPLSTKELEESLVVLSGRDMSAVLGVSQTHPKLLPGGGVGRLVVDAYKYCHLRLTLAKDVPLRLPYHRVALQFHFRHDRHAHSLAFYRFTERQAPQVRPAFSLSSQRIRR